MEPIPDPDIEEGIEYWKTQPASLDGVLGELKRDFKPRSKLTANSQEGMVLG
jgi:protein N-terminal methyltransferase